MCAENPWLMLSGAGMSCLYMKAEQRAENRWKLSYVPCGWAPVRRLMFCSRSSARLFLVEESTFCAVPGDSAGPATSSIGEWATPVYRTTSMILVISVSVRFVSHSKSQRVDLQPSVLLLFTNPASVVNRDPMRA